LLRIPTVLRPIFNNVTTPFEQRGIEGLTSFDVGGSASYLTVKQEVTLPRNGGHL
jgi:hypothetical protein